MPKQKYQRPEVYAAGKREKLWKAEWREYFMDAEGKERSRHKSKTWSRANFTKADAQAALDTIMRELHQGAPKADGSMSLAAFWDEIYYPLRAGRWGINTRKAADYIWRLYILPALGVKKLNEITKSAIELHLLKLADSGKGEALVRGVAVRIHSVLAEAFENDFIPKNPARKIELPRCSPAKQTRSMTEDEVRRLWDASEGRDYVMWRVLLLTGSRIGEVLALERSDLLSGGLRIDQSALDRQASTTKNLKTRVVPIPPALRSELEEWLGTHEYNLVFPSFGGKMYRHDDTHMRAIFERARAAAKIPDLTFRMCRTTFATLFEGDIKDAQEILGHHSPAFTLQVYRKPVTDRQQRAVEEMERRLNVVPMKKPA